MSTKHLLHFCTQRKLGNSKEARVPKRQSALSSVERRRILAVSTMIQSRLRPNQQHVRDWSASKPASVLMQQGAPLNWRRLSMNIIVHASKSCCLMHYLGNSVTSTSTEDWGLSWARPAEYLVDFMRSRSLAMTPQGPMDSGFSSPTCFKPDAEADRRCDVLRKGRLPLWDIRFGQFDPTVLLSIGDSTTGSLLHAATMRSQG